ncbi:MAG: hypothetical protein KBT14_00160 [Proteobacteria bacterium]|nr:hypothetical protein [Candidatus Enterousia onthequi]
MTKKMPGFNEYQADLEKKQQFEKEKEEGQKREFAKMQIKKLGSIFNQTSKKNSAFGDFLRSFFQVQVIAFLTGSMAFLFSGRTQFVDDYGNTTGGLFNNPLNEIYGDDMSYGQAIKNAYLLEDWHNGKGGVFQGVCGLLSMIIALSVATVAGAKKIKSNVFKSRDILLQLDKLKKYGVDAKQLIESLEPSVVKLISKMSEKDRGYFDNLASGGLDKANYDTCVAIVSGYLKSHPKEYNKVIEIIDEATLPEAVKKKYGKGKIISFAAAQELQTER